MRYSYYYSKLNIGIYLAYCVHRRTIGMDAAGLNPNGVYGTYNDSSAGLDTTTGGVAYDRNADGHGAMLFIVITLCVYSLGIAAFVAGHIYRRAETKLQDAQIADYLSSIYTRKIDRIVRLERIQATAATVHRLLEHGNMNNDDVEEKLHQTLGDITEFEEDMSLYADNELTNGTLVSERLATCDYHVIKTEDGSIHS